MASGAILKCLVPPAFYLSFYALFLPMRAELEFGYAHRRQGAP
jgi:hypothetical protein